MPARDGSLPVFELVQPDLFSDPGGQPNAWAVNPATASRPLVVKTP
jgi:hypothetical protein